MATIEIVVWKRNTDERELELILEDVEQMYAWTSLKDKHCCDAFDADWNAPGDGLGSVFDEHNLEVVQMIFYNVKSFEHYYEHVFDVLTYNKQIANAVSELALLIDRTQQRFYELYSQMAHLSDHVVNPTARHAEDLMDHMMWEQTEDQWTAEAAEFITKLENK
jgi:hypothetical protein